MMMPPACKVMSATSGFPITMVAARSGSRISLAWSILTAIGPPVGTGAANADAGTSRSAIASDRNSEYARTAMRRELTDILYPGTCTSRQKRYAAEPAPDMANLTLIDERTANGRGKPLVAVVVIPGRERNERTRNPDTVR